MAKTFTVQDFFKRFPDDNACLQHLMKVRYGERMQCPRCGKEGKFHRIRKLPAFACAWCGHHVHPMAGTPFERSTTPLQKWFYAMYLFTTSRHGVPAKELQRQLSVTYKTAWRMGHEIRKYMGKVDGDDPLSGTVEVDESFLGGRSAGSFGSVNKMIVLGMLQRQGPIITKVIPDTKRPMLLGYIKQYIYRGSVISTDEAPQYKHLPLHGYEHIYVHHAAKQYVKGKAHTNSLENFWSILKRSISGTHVHVSKRHLPKYLGEFEYRYNLRNYPELMFPLLLAGFKFH